MGLTTVSALAYLFFNLYTPPCFAAIGAMNSELKSRKWLLAAVGLQLAPGYTVAFLVTQIRPMVVYGHLADAFVPGLLAVIRFVAITVITGIKVRAGFDKKYRLDGRLSGSISLE